MSIARQRLAGRHDSEGPTSGSAASGSRSSKLAMRGRRGTAIRIAPPGGVRGALLEPEHVLGRQQAGALEPGHDAVAAHAGARRDDRMRIVEQRRIAAELVDHDTL